MLICQIMDNNTGGGHDHYENLTDLLKSVEIDSIRYNQLKTSILDKIDIKKKFAYQLKRGKISKILYCFCIKRSPKQMDH